jgi:hypothetical protein
VGWAYSHYTTRLSVRQSVSACPVPVASGGGLQCAGERLVRQPLPVHAAKRQNESLAVIQFALIEAEAFRVEVGKCHGSMLTCVPFTHLLKRLQKFSIPFVWTLPSTYFSA